MSATRLKIYGKPASRTFRVIWCARELGLDYEIVPIQSADGSIKSTEYLTINPNGKIPTIKDGDLVLWESIAINCHLAKTRGKGGLWPQTPEGEALALQWSFWAVAEVEPDYLTVLLHRAHFPKAERNPALAADAEASLQAPFKVLDQALAATGYLIGENFSIADLNTAGILSWATTFARLDLAPFPHLAKWLDASYSRPAARQADPLKHRSART